VGYSSVKFFVNIHAAVDYADNGDLIGIDDVKDQMQAHHEAPKLWSQTGAFLSDERDRARLSKFASILRSNSLAATGLRSARWR
jgi:hypothetical protein